jgi:DNA polymerase-3 subunit chi
MTQIDFYLLSTNKIALQMRYACILAELEYQQGKTVYINMQSMEDCKMMDEKLWAFRDNSFIPHNIAGQGSAPIIIGCAPNVPTTDDILINLCHPVPDFFSRFYYVKEIVIEEEQIKANSRENFRYYRDRGYPLQHHKINTDTI